MAAAACSIYHGRATLNELYALGNTERWVEIKRLDPDVGDAWRDWQVLVRSPGQAATLSFSANVDESGPPWFRILTPGIPSKDLLNFKAMDLRLVDTAGATIDYVSVGGYSNIGNGGCTPVFPWQAPAVTSSNKDLQRIADGTGDWIVPGEGNSGDTSPSSDNAGPGPDGQPLATISAVDITVAAGADAVFTLTFSQAKPYATRISYETQDGTASAGSDYVASSGTIDIPASATGVEVRVPTLPGATVGSTFRLFIYDGVYLSISDHYAEATFTAPLGPHHIRINQDASALTCQREQVTLQACANADCSSLFAGDVQVTLTPAGKWVGGDTRTISGGSATASLRQTTAATLTLGTSAVAPAASESSRCYNVGTLSDCKVTFSTAGFIVDVPNQIACTTSGSLKLKAVKANPLDPAAACVADGGFANTTRDVGFWSLFNSPKQGTEPLQVNGTAVGTTSPGSPVSLAFDGNAEADLNVAYRDAGELELRARFDGSGEESGLVMEGGDAFVVRPHGFYLAATTDGSTALDGTTATASPQLAAGGSFRQQIRAQCADGTVTPSYSPSNAELWVEMLAPVASATSTPGTFRLKGNVSASPPPAPAVSVGAGPAPDPTATWSNISAAFSDGVVVETGASYANASYDEVGIIKLHVRDPNYFGTAVPASELTVGRFRPDRFEVTLTQPTFAAASGSFTYLGQPFVYATPPRLIIEARNVFNARTYNYEGDFWKLDTGLAAGKPAAFTYLNNVAGATLQTPAIEAGFGDTSNVDGYIELGALHAGESFVYERPALPVTPFDADVSLGISVNDGETSGNAQLPHIGFSMDTLDDPDGIAGSGDEGFNVINNDSLLRYGRVRLTNGYGSEMKPVRVPLVAEYFDGARFVRNTDDNATTLAISNLTLSNNVETGQTDGSILLRAGVTGSETNATLVDGDALAAGFQMTSGDAGLSFSPVDAGSTGYAEVRLNLDAAGLPWLKHDWDGNCGPANVPPGCFDNPPPARASFGIYRGSDRVIYIREVY